MAVREVLELKKLNLLEKAIQFWLNLKKKTDFLSSRFPNKSCHEKS